MQNSTWGWSVLYSVILLGVSSAGEGEQGQRARRRARRVVRSGQGAGDGPQLDTLWKVKASQRKALERKVTKACAPPAPLKPAPPPPLFAKIEGTDARVLNLSTSYKVTLGGSETALYIAFDSVVNLFTGDAVSSTRPTRAVWVGVGSTGRSIGAAERRCGTRGGWV